MLFSTAKKILNITEEWKDSIRARDGSTHEIFRNPSSKEISDLYKKEKPIEFRYIVKLFGKGPSELYLFNADLLHFEAAKNIGIPYKTRAHAPIWGDYGFGVSLMPPTKKMKLDSAIIKEIKTMGEKNFDMEFLRKYFSNI